jgi:hypothetical protein
MDHGLAALGQAFGKAVELLGELAGMWLRAKEAQRVVERCQSVVESYEAARWEQAAGDLLGGKACPDVLYLLADGVQTPLIGRWRETKIGVARGVRVDGELAERARYVSGLEEAEAFGLRWAALAEASGVAHAGTVVVLGDGARWFWNQAQLHFPQAIEILDVWHALERL